jgi:phosphoglycolate phosphatase
MTEVRTVLFDLDGTLADTAPDLGHALDTLRAEHGLGPLPPSAVRREASHGAAALVRAGFGIEPGSARFDALRRRFLEHYRATLCHDTRLFPGMEQVLAALERGGRHWGIVTNKPSNLTDPLVESLGLAQRAVCVISGDSTANRKPHPEPLLHAARLARTEPGQCLYVGDAERDIRAGRDAGMQTLVALFGYLREDDNPGDWCADGSVSHPMEILEWIARHV